MKLTNQIICEKAAEIQAAFSKETKYIPVKLNFAIQKNLANLIKLQEEIEVNRLKIASEYGELDEANQRYIILDNNREIVMKEMNDLFSIEQEIEIKTPVYSITVILLFLIP